MRVLVSGGAGYIGSHTVVQLVAAGHDVVVVDSFANAKPSVVGRLEALTGKPLDVRSFDLTDHDKTEHLFAHEPFDAVIHFAGLKAVGESVEKPLEYYENNLVSTFSLVRAMRRHGVPKLVFSSSATVYGANAPVPMHEDLPTSATNPYGWSKVMIEQVLRDVAAADPSWRIALLRYFNPVGAHPSGTIGEDPSDIPNNLMPYIAQVAVGRRDKLSIFGGDYPTPDGTGVRDYIHVDDLAAGHIAALNRLGSTVRPGLDVEPRHRPRDVGPRAAHAVRAGLRPRAALRGRRPPAGRRRGVLRGPLTRRGRAGLARHPHRRRHVCRHLALAEQEPPRLPGRVIRPRGVPAGSALRQLGVEAEHVPRGVPERAVPHAVELVHRLLETPRRRRRGRARTARPRRHTGR